MSSSLIIGLEMAGVLGAVLVWGAWELWTLRREKEKDKLKAEAGDLKSSPPAAEE